MIDELCTIEMENKWDFCIYLFFAPECLQMLTMKKKNLAYWWEDLYVTEDHLQNMIKEKLSIQQ